MNHFSFIHASDLHLDSPFKGVTARSPVIADMLRSATFDAFNNLVQLCIDKEAQFLLVAGDIYDGADRSLRAQLKFFDGLKRLVDHNITSFVAHGNHDPLDGWSSTIKWPNGVHIFGADQVETRTAEIDGKPVASVSGISYGKKNETDNLALKFKAVGADLLQGLFKIGILHCNCGNNSDYEAYAPCHPENLISAAFDYWALGHVHEKKILSKNPYIVYPGNTQGLSIRESGERGCYFVSVTDNLHVDIEFFPLDVVRWVSTEISIADISSINDLDRKIAETIDSFRKEAKGRPVICRISLIGRGPIYRDLRHETAMPELLEKVQEEWLEQEPFIWVQNINMNCFPEIDPKQRRKINDLLGQVLCASKELNDMIREKNGDQKTAGDVLMPAFRELCESHRAEKLLESISPDMFERILLDSEQLCIDLLETQTHNPQK